MSTKEKVAVLSTLAILLLSGLSSPVLATETHPFHLEKHLCSGALSSGRTCVVTFSSFKAIPVGTIISYSGPDINHLVAVINVPHGSATGHCATGSVFAHTGPGICIFETGTGRLTQFHLNVAVTTDYAGNWFWDGTYWFGGEQ